MKKSFTLIELLVVIAIIAGLVTILLPNFMDARSRAKDNQRKSDIRQIQKALELYRQNQPLPEYPLSLPAACGQWIENSVVYLNIVPPDPLYPCNTATPYPYYYVRDPSVNGDKGAYVIYACVENAGDKDGGPCPFGGGQGFKDVTGYMCPNNVCISVTQP